jgi:hypothetical protein
MVNWKVSERRCSWPDRGLSKTKKTSVMTAGVLLGTRTMHLSDTCLVRYL